MEKELRLKTNHNPSYINKDMLLGGLVGFAIPGVGLVGSAALAVAGLVGGGYIGRERLEQENKNGKAVTDNPSFWNKDTIIGGLIGWNAVGLALLAAVGVAATVSVATPVLPVVALGLGLTAVPALIVAGVYKGGKHGQKQAMEEFTQAIQQAQAIKQDAAISQQPDLGAGKEKDISYTKTVEAQRNQSPEQQR